MKPFTCSLIAAILIGAIYLAGCLPSPSPTPGINETAAPEPSLTPSPTLSPTQTRMARPTATGTREPLPTLPPAEAFEKVEELLETNGGCAFPCWWGITPGKTSWNEVLDMLQPIAWRMSSLKNHPVYKDKVTREFYFAFDDEPTLINSLMVIFVLEKETLEIEWIVSGQPYDLLFILDTYGAPDEILINADGIPVTGPAAYDYNLIYSKHGIIAGGGRDAKVIHRNGEDFALICQSDFKTDARGLVFWSPELKLEFKDVFIQYESIENYLLLETVIGMNQKEFTTFILENDAGNCLEIPMSKWEK
ncbi:MAG TPA: hypothetical protein VN364_01195 [Bellilinea sp.]|nr:hypothetical protein [Bellilinea sp.]